MRFNLTIQRLAVAILFILLFAMAVRIPIDADMWWHLRTAQYMLQTHAVPLTDPFSITRLNQPWINQSWGSQLIMYGFYKLFGGAGVLGDGGNVGLAVYTALLAVGGMAFVYLMCDGSVYLRGFIVILAAAAAAVFWSPRPQMASFMLSAAVLYLLYLYKWRKVDRLWLIPVVTVIWANLHAGFAVGFIFMGGTIAGEILGRLFDSKNPNVLSWVAIRKLIIIAVISGLVVVINPNTVQLLLYPFKTVSIGALQQYIQEWASPDFHGHETWPFIALLIAILAVVGIGSRRLDWTDLVLVSGTTFMALYAGRNIATFAIAAAPVLARHLNALLTERGVIFPRSRPSRGPALILNYVILILVLFGATAKVVLVLNPKLVASEQAKQFPVKAVDYLNKNNPSGPMFNTYNWGGYILFAAPQYKDFVDGRTDLFDDVILTQWLQAIQGQDWQKTFQQWGIKLVFVEHDSALAKLLRQQADWKETYSDDQASIFEQTGQQVKPS